MYEEIDGVSLGAERLPKLKEFGAGTYVLEVLTFGKHNTQNHGPGVLAEFEILNSTNEAHPPGSKASYMLLEKYNQYNLYWKNLAALGRGFIGVKPDSAQLTKLLDSSNPAKGTKVQVEIVKEDGKAYNKFNWIYMPQ